MKGCADCRSRSRIEAVIRFALRHCPRKWKQKAIMLAGMYLLSEVISFEELKKYAAGS